MALFQKECPECYGHGQYHTSGRNGDPEDAGVICENCDGTGIVDVELDEDGDEI